LIDRTKRSALAFAFGVRSGISTTRVPDAKHQRVRAWFANGNDTFVQLGTFREEHVEPARLPEAMGDGTERR
jgi:hypothetical protein